MHQFVQNKRGHGPQVPASAVDRRTIAAATRVKPQTTRLDHPNEHERQDHHSQRNQHGQPSGRARLPLGEPREGFGPGMKQDAFDTDAESLDTTQQSHRTMQAAKAHEHVHDEDDYSEGEVDEDDEQQRLAEQQRLVEQQALQLELSQYDMPAETLTGQFRIPQRNDMFGADSSYPPTTAGPDESSFQQRQQQQQEKAILISSERSESEPPTSPPHQQETHRHASPSPVPLRRPPSAPQRLSQMNSPVNVFQTGAQLRRAQQPKLPHRNSNMHIPLQQPLPVGNSQPPAYTQIEREDNMRHNPRSFNAPVQHKPTLPAPRVEPPVQPLPQRGRVAPVINHPRVPAPNPPQEQGLQRNEDYDDQTLFQKTFKQLKTENFDFDPNAQPILTDNLRRKPLSERLEHVRRNLSPEEQFKFFSSLSLAEWEESGDWFVGQFTEVVGKMKEGRQQKRRIAKKYEDEIEKREQEVATSQGRAERELAKMKNQGMGLLPRTPRKVF